MKQNSIMDKLRSFVQVRTSDEAHHFQKRSRNSNNNTTKKPSAHEIACKKWKTCEECVSITSGNYQCLWCKKGDKCSHYPYKHIVPQSSECDWENARWGVCWVDFRAMVITVSIIGAVLLIAICCCNSKVL
uniref:PSI domain-containing protein n=1 Tax=Ciona savignyi TaxID=51511 RepID=H2YMW4_CIOSA